MFRALIPLALLPAALHWWWTRSVTDTAASAVLPERHLAITQRVSFVTMLCIVTIILGAGWHAVWILPVQFVALAASIMAAAVSRNCTNRFIVASLRGCIIAPFRSALRLRSA